MKRHTHARVHTDVNYIRSILSAVNTEDKMFIAWECKNIKSNRSEFIKLLIDYLQDVHLDMNAIVLFVFYLQFNKV